MTVFELIDSLRDFDSDDEVRIGTEYNCLPVKEVSQYASRTIHIEPDTEVKDSDIHFGNDLPQPDRQIIDRAIAKAAETPVGQPIDMAACFGFDKEQ